MIEEKLVGKNKNLNEQIKILETIIKKNKTIIKILKILEKYSEENPQFKDYYLSAGCINQTIFNYYHNFDLNYGIKDYDIVYFDEDTSYEKEDSIIKELEKRFNKLNLSFDIKNENRVPIWYEEKYNIKRKKYYSVEDAISRWGTTITCLGVRMTKNKLIICCPYGLNDLFSLIIRPVKSDYEKENYIKKVTSWKEKWPMLEIKEWEE